MTFCIVNPVYNPPKRLIRHLSGISGQFSNINLLINPIIGVLPKVFLGQFLGKQRNYGKIQNLWLRNCSGSLIFEM